MEIRRLLFAIARKWWLIVLLVLLGGGVGLLRMFSAKPMYQADTALYIMNRDKVLMTGQSLNSQDITASQQIVQQYSDIVNSRSVISAVLNDVKNYNLTENEIKSMISIDSSKNSGILTIGAVSLDPNVAAAVANATGQEFSNEMQQLTNTNNIGVLDAAQVPKYPVPNNGSKIILLGILAGLLVAFGIIYIIEYFDTTVRSVEDIERGLKVRVIGIIPEHDIR